ncbi:NAD kinase [Paenibacillus sp. SC116]|uniref:NAD kinase n=1 Tax=Paenibacillus sp. SC116 TaxID=2968986 RepID=UPI00215A668E|nr:NAD kinase [Paenibacillus sp. SC116]MCR8846051.1 NAD kinase [Paenibacillus sp. SC116]
MKYAILNRGDELSLELTERFHYLAAEQQLIHHDESPDIVVSIGGDGTMLQAFHRYIDQLNSTAFVGIHTGHLGFYADWKADEIELLVQLMGNHHQAETLQPRIVKYPLIDLIVTTHHQETTRYTALNEFTLKGIDGTLVAQIDINDQLFEMFRGDGICVSTPSGSTAYNKSLGGAMVHPSIASIQLAEIASINNRVFRTLGSSLVLPKHHHFDIFSRKEQRLLLTIDHLNSTLDNLSSIRCQVSDQTVTFVRYRPFPFWNRVREAFLGYE